MSDIIELILQATVLAGVIAIVSLLSYYYKYNRQCAKYKHIPGVCQILPESPFAFPIPFFGPYLFRGNFKTMVELSSLFRKEKVFKVTAGLSTYVFVNNKEVAKKVMIHNKENYYKPTALYSGLTMYGPNIVTVAGGYEHQRHHKVVEPAFLPNMLKYLVSVSIQSTDLLLERIFNKDGAMEVNSDLTDVTMDIIGKSNFGVDLRVFKAGPTKDHNLIKLDESKQAMSFYDALATTSTWAVVLWSILPPSVISWCRPIWSAKTAVENYLLELLNQRKTYGYEERSDLISLLLKSNELGEGKSKLTDQEMLADAFIFLFAGHETSATVMGHLFCDLAKNPDVQMKCIEELDRVLKGRSFTYDDRSSLPYLHNCIYECLRMHSPIVAVPKVAAVADELGDYKIPKGTNILVNTYIAHMNEEDWKEPHIFKPDRFNEKYDPSAFLTFSYGARTCVGKQFAMMEIMAVVSRILQTYRFEFPSHINPQTHEPIVETLVTAKIKKEYLLLKKHAATSA